MYRTSDLQRTPLEMQYLRQSRERLGGFMPRRLVDEQVLTVPDLSVFKAQIDGTGEREISSTMALFNWRRCFGTKSGQACCLHRARRSAHVRHGGYVPPVGHLFF